MHSHPQYLMVICTASVISSGIILIEANTAGTPFTTEITKGDMDISIVRVNQTATLDEVNNGIKKVVNDSPVPVSADINSDDVIVLTGSNAGEPFNITNGNNVTIELITAAEKATVSEILQGLVDSINDTDESVVAVSKNTYMKIVSNDHYLIQNITLKTDNMTMTEKDANETTLSEILNGVSKAINNYDNTILTSIIENNDIIITAVKAGLGYDISIVSDNMVLTHITDNQTGCTVIDLPADPKDGTIVHIRDIKDKFADYNVTVNRNGALMNGKDEDLILDVDSTDIELIYFNNDWGYE